MPIPPYTKRVQNTDTKHRFRQFSGAVSVLIAGLAIGHANAQGIENCLVDPPNSEGFALMKGDFPPHEGWMKKQMVDRVLSYENGMKERFNKDGTYELTLNGRTWTAPRYRMYSGVFDANQGGFVCIDFPDLKFQRYVVHKTKLTLIDGFGDRYTATVTK